MKTEDLRTQGLTQEQIDYVFAEHGKELNPIKQERDNFKSQYGNTIGRKWSIVQLFP